MNENQNVEQKTKFCKRCGEKIFEDAVICPKCGCQVEEIKNNSQPQVVVNNNNVANANARAYAGGVGREKNKWVALALCFFFGVFGVHKFYEGKIGMGILYLCTFGLIGFGAFIDFIVLLFKPNPYCV